MRYLITGGAGFIGSHLIKYLLADAANTVLCVDKLNYAGHRQRLASVKANARLHFEQLDICQTQRVGVLLASFCPEVVINLAAQTHVDNSIADPAPFLQSNIVGTQGLLQASLSYWQGLDSQRAARFRFYQISTDEVFGEHPGEGPLCDESAAYRPSSPYAASKAAADHLVQAWHRTYGLPTLISRSSNNYGPWQHGEKLIPAVIYRALHGQKVILYGSGKQMRDWLHVSDHVRAIALIATRGKVGQSYNLCSETWLDNASLVRRVLAALEEFTGRVASISLVKDRPGHDFCYRCSSAKARAELGWRPLAEFEDALRDTVQSYIENPSRLAPPP